MCNIEYSDIANNDMRELFYFIAREKGMLITAQRYLQGLKDLIEYIAKNPTICPIKYSRSLLEYGFNVRRANYKKMAIIYTFVEGKNTIYIHRVIAASMITGI